jgi:hypothetical protein
LTGGAVDEIPELLITLQDATGSGDLDKRTTPFIDLELEDG